MGVVSEKTCMHLQQSQAMLQPTLGSGGESRSGVVTQQMSEGRDRIHVVQRLREQGRHCPVQEVSSVVPGHDDRCQRRFGPGMILAHARSLDRPERAIAPLRQSHGPAHPGAARVVRVLEVRATRGSGRSSTERDGRLRPQSHRPSRESPYRCDWSNVRG